MLSIHCLISFICVFLASITGSGSKSLLHMKSRWCAPPGSIIATSDGDRLSCTPNPAQGSRYPFVHTTLLAHDSLLPPNTVVAHNVLGRTPHRRSHSSTAAVSFHGCSKNMSRTPSLDMGMNISVQYW